MTTIATGQNKLLFNSKEYVAAWVDERIPDIVHGFGECNAIGVVAADGIHLIAGVVYNEYQPEFRTMQLSIAADNPRWAQKHLISRLLYYPFIELDIFKCWITTPSDNVKSLKLTKHIGFKPEATLAHHFGKGRHGIISRMFKPDFMRLYHDQKLPDHNVGRQSPVL